MATVNEQTFANQKAWPTGAAPAEKTGKFETVKLPAAPRSAAVARLAAAIARLPSSGRGPNSSNLFLP